ncbi:MAG: hypothetical protein IJQ00_03845, partial [Kiritimatiellae bacterium]|nr:hypothetical protein [Kiritimatiellia bacterium]
MKTSTRVCLATAILAATAALGAVASAESCRADAFSAVRHGENVGGAPCAAPAVKAVGDSVCMVSDSVAMSNGIAIVDYVLKPEAE